MITILIGGGSSSFFGGSVVPWLLASFSIFFFFIFINNKMNQNNLKYLLYYYLFVAPTQHANQRVERKLQVLDSIAPIVFPCYSRLNGLALLLYVSFQTPFEFLKRCLFQIIFLNNLDFLFWEEKQPLHCPLEPYMQWNQPLVQLYIFTAAR